MLIVCKRDRFHARIVLIYNPAIIANPSRTRTTEKSSVFISSKQNIYTLHRRNRQRIHLACFSRVTVFRLDFCLARNETDIRHESDASHLSAKDRLLLQRNIGIVVVQCVVASRRKFRKHACVVAVRLTLIGRAKNYLIAN